jgi:hypothetical protein
MHVKKTSKAEFLRSIPASMPLEEVMARAHKAGVSVSLREVTVPRDRAFTKKWTGRARRHAGGSREKPTIDVGSSRRVNKSAFVRALPETLSAAQVVAKAKEAGITLSEKHVSVIRSLARSKTRAAAPKARVVGRAGVAESRRRSTSDREVEQRLADLVLAHGARHVEAALAAIRERMMRAAT